MKNWKNLLWIFGSLLVVASLLLYIRQVTSCYPPPGVWKKFSPDELSAFIQTCRLRASPTSRFADFLVLFTAGASLFTAHWLALPPIVKARRGGLLSAFLVLMLLVSLFLTASGLLGYPVPGDAAAPAAWVVEAIAALGFLSYIGLLALWRWKRWGGMLFQGAAIALAAFSLLAGGSRLLSAILVLGVVILALLLRPVRYKMV
jgi:hypothetical protein